MAITIEGGIAIGGGINVSSNAPTFTVNSGDITYDQQLYGGYSSATSAGFTCDGNRDTWNGIVYATTVGLHNDITAAWAAAGFNTDNTYAWNVSFASGGNIIARVAVDPDGFVDTLAIVPIDQTDTRWQSGTLGGPTQAGVFTFPAIFAPYTPTTVISGANNWC
jgi:hypothetical protein